MVRKGKKKSKTLQDYKAYTDAFAGEINIYQDSAKHLFTRWEKKLHEFEDTALHYHLTYYHRILIRQMEFKDKLIEKLQNELNEFSEHRRTTAQANLELVENTLGAFKKEMEEIHDEYQVMVRGALPENLAELEVRANENNSCWKILKYYENVTKLLAKKKNSKIKKKYIGYKDLENGRFQSIVNTFHRSDLTRCKQMTYDYKYTLFEYKLNSENLMKDYLKLKKKYGHLCVLKTELNHRIEHLSNTISNLEKEIKEPKSQKEINNLIEERHALEEGLKKFIKKVANHTESGEKHLSLLCMSTKPIHDEINTALKKGNDILKWIMFCEKLETPEEKAKPWSTRNTSSGITLPEHSAELEIFSNFLNHISDVKINSKLIDNEIKKLHRKNNELKKKIRFIVQNK